MNRGMLIAGILLIAFGASVSVVPLNALSNANKCSVNQYYCLHGAAIAVLFILGFAIFILATGGILVLVGVVSGGSRLNNRKIQN